MIEAVREQRRCQSRIMSTLSLNISLFDQTKPMFEQVRRVGEEREYLLQHFHLDKRFGLFVTEASILDGTGCYRPKFYKILRREENGVILRQQILNGRAGNSML
jgi:hypothetical protein